MSRPRSVVGRRLAGWRAFRRRLRQAARWGTSQADSIPRGRYARDYLRWRVRHRVGPRVHAAGSESLDVFLLSYKRPQNITPIVRSLLTCAFVRRVHVANNNPDLRLRDWLRVSSPRLDAWDVGENRGVLYRHELVCERGGAFNAILDDDLFLSAVQIRRLFDELRVDPSVPHGMFGQRIRDAGLDADFDAGDSPDAFEHCVTRCEGRVDTLNRAYFVTAEHAQRHGELVVALSTSFSRAEIDRADDLILAFAGDGRPRIHDVGPFLECPSEAEPGVAVFLEDGFAALRLRVYRRLRDLTASRRSAG